VNDVVSAVPVETPNAVIATSISTADSASVNSISDIAAPSSATTITARAVVRRSTTAAS